jgi:hypothetical protein
METAPNPLARFFGVFIQGQTYLNMLYLLLAFPLGLFYFIFLVVGLATGLALVIVWVGLLLLALVIAGWWAFAVFERQLAIWLLNVDIPPMSRQEPRQPGTWPTIVAYLKNPVTWKSLVYLFVKFPLGLLSFIILVTFGAITLALLTAPVTYQFMPIQVWFTDTLYWQIDTLGWAVLAFFIGVGLMFVSMHLFNGLAWLSGCFARLMLGNYQTPVTGEPAAIPPQPAEMAIPAPASPEPGAVPPTGQVEIPPEPATPSVEPIEQPDEQPTQPETGAESGTPPTQIDG